MVKTLMTWLLLKAILPEEKRIFKYMWQKKKKEKVLVQVISIWKQSGDLAT